MICSRIFTVGAHLRPSARPLAAVALLAAGMGSAQPAFAYIGTSFLQVPGLSGDSRGKTFRNWVRLTANYWGEAPRQPSQFEGTGRKRTYFSGPRAPRSGAGTLSIALDKNSPSYAGLMAQCTANAAIGELRYAESSDMARAPAELGPRPAGIPEFFEYKLKDVKLSCPVLENAPEQGFVLSFGDIEWLNYRAEAAGVEFVPPPAKLSPASASGQTKSFIVTWLSPALDATADQCPALNKRPAEADYYALMTPEAAAKEKAQRAPQGGIAAHPTDGQLSFRGPGKLSVTAMPGVIIDPGHVAPQSKIAHGFDLDGNDGTGKPPAITRRHVNYVSEDGRTGIDNQLFTVAGCIPGFKRKGLLTSTRNEAMRNGLISIVIMISGIDDEKNDDDVDVTVLYSDDPIVKNGAGSQILPQFTYSASASPELTHLFSRLHGRIENGVVVTEPVRQMTVNEGREPRVTLFGARMRIAFQPDGTIKAALGGYQDWRVLLNFWSAYSSGFEAFMGFQTPGAYSAFKRAADGLRDPETGEFNGISSAYDIEGTPAFVPPEQRAELIGRGKRARR